MHGVLRVGGRLQRSILPVDFKHQIILPLKHHVIALIIDYCHCREGHCSAQHVLAALHKRFCVLKGQSYIKSVIGQCKK